MKNTGKDKPKKKKKKNRKRKATQMGFYGLR